MITGQKSGNPHVALVVVSHRVVSVHRSENLLMVIAVCN